MSRKPKTEKRKRDLFHVELDAAHREKFDKLHAHLASQPALQGVLRVTPSHVVRYAIGQAFERMEKPAA